MAAGSQGRSDGGSENLRSNYLCVTEVDVARLDSRDSEERNRIQAALVQLESAV